MLSHVRVLLLLVCAGSAAAARIKQSPSELSKPSATDRGAKAHSKQQPPDAAKQSTDASVAKAAEVTTKDVAEKHASLLHATASAKHVVTSAHASAPKEVSAPAKHAQTQAASQGTVALVQGKQHGEAIARHAVASAPQSVPEGDVTTSKPAKGMPRMQLFFGIATFLVIMISGAFCLIGKLMGPAKDTTQGETRKKSRAKSHGEVSAGEKSVQHYKSGLQNVEVRRKQHIHDGRVIYEWGQNDDVAMLYTKVPEGVEKEDLEIMITPSRVQVGRKGKPPFISEETYAAIDDEGSYWRLCSGGELQIRLQKESPETWPSLLIGQ